MALKPAQKALGPIRRSFAPWLDPSAVPLIRFENVTKRFGDFVAVDDISLDIHQREFFALLGPSGCGKTTLMRMLAGFEEPTSGRVTLGGKDLAGMPPYRRPVNMMFQSYALFPHMSVEQNVAFGLKQDGLPKTEIAERVTEMLKLVKLESFASRKPHQLSGGQRQRVALARAVAKRPKVLLLDEPLGALDKKLREETQFELMDLQMELGLTFLIVTHDQEEAMTVADRIAVMNHGKLVQVATPGDIYEQPNSRYVADFIGDINILEAKVAGAGPAGLSLAVKDPAAPITVAAPEARPADGAEVAFAIRPEKMRIAIEPPPADAVNVLKGEVWDIAYFGDWTKFLVKLEGSDTIMRVSRANATRTESAPIAWDDKVHVWFAPDAGVLLTA
ncbi:polyamine-transporting ATPase [Methylopila jiangsuensis]|uniref:Spermidine/putrescine import ATP-binding protein PotA n=1 Tax=Methylopila jiangsuensis TaxID=586230 RepID=A0A9W6JH83_9HYPH|nr:ABC transporter ATP-binding protein [Methylopila jiangsuensis]MDR6285952.1 putrescine transport system ATP-binding protein [Methylopila jiangsuensis]GLK75709.1 polyamine-transporting ATPase [Methylopila jiangsuensis]